MEPKGCIVTNWSEASTMLLESPRPIGMIIISADVGLKNKFVYHTLDKTLSAVCITSGLCKVERLRSILEEASVVCVGLTPQASCNHKKRHNIVTMLHNVGIEEIYAVYLPASHMDFADHYLTKQANQRLAKLKANPPTADGLSALFVLSEGYDQKHDQEKEVK